MPRRKPQPPTTARKRLTRTELNAAAWARWETTAKNWQGLNDRLQARIEFKNISRTQAGYQVRIHRGGKKVFDRSILGHSEESLLEALRVRDEALQRAPESSQRPSAVPARVLKALGLSAPVPGIYRLASRSVYRVFYRQEGRRILRQFYYRVVPEEAAYAAAIDFVQSRLQK